MPFQKTCKVCKKVVVYETQDDLAEFFYKKDGYYIHTCKECERAKVNAKYNSGRYNYRKKKHNGYDDTYRVGTLE